MTATLITVSGCDDSTSVIVELTPEQAEGVRLVAEAITAASSCLCMPTMTTREAAEADQKEIDGE